MKFVLDFEKPLEKLEKLKLLSITGADGEMSLVDPAIVYEFDEVSERKALIILLIPHEECPSILLGISEKASEPARALKLTAEDLFSFGLIDGIIEKPHGEAHGYSERAMSNGKQRVISALRKLRGYLWKNF